MMENASSLIDITYRSLFLHPLLMIAVKGFLVLLAVEALLRLSDWSATRRHNVRLGTLVFLLALLPLSVIGPELKLSLPNASIVEQSNTLDSWSHEDSGQIRPGVIMGRAYDAKRTIAPADDREPREEVTEEVWPVLLASTAGEPTNGTGGGTLPTPPMPDAGHRDPVRDDSPRVIELRNQSADAPVVMGSVGSVSQGGTATAAPANAAATTVATASSPAASKALVRGAERIGSSIWITLVLGWLLGVMLYGSRMLVGLFRVRSLVRRARRSRDGRIYTMATEMAARMGIDRLVDLRLSREISVPVTAGCMQPVVVLPADAPTWDEDRLRLVLTHEFAHIRRNDWAGHLAARITTILYWYLPIVWRFERRLHLERECACDTLVVAHGRRATDYAAHLVAFARDVWTQRSPVPALSMIKTSELEERIMTLLNPHSSGRKRNRLPMLAAAGIALFALPLAFLQPTVSAEPANERLRVAAREKAAEAAEVEAVRRNAFAGRMLEDYGRAIDGYRELVELEPDNVDAWFWLGFCQLVENDNDASIPAFERVLELEESRKSILNWGVSGTARNAQYNIACAHAKEGRADAAFAALRTTISEYGDVQPGTLLADPDLASLRGRDEFTEVVIEAAEKSGTIGELEKIIDRVESGDITYELGERDGEDWYNAGTNLFGMELYDDAIIAYEKAIAMDHDPAASAYNIACAHALSGDVDHALDALERSVELGWDDAAHMQYDDDLDALHDSERFTSLVERVAEEHGSHAEHKISIAGGDGRSFFSWGGETSEAATAFDRGYELVTSGKPEKAVAQFQKSLKGDYNPQLSHYNLACCYSLMGETDKAFEHLEKSIELGYYDANHAEKDSDLENLRSDDRWPAMVEMMRASHEEYEEVRRAAEEEAKAAKHAAVHWQNEARATSINVQRIAADAQREAAMASREAARVGREVAREAAEAGRAAAREAQQLAKELSERAEELARIARTQDNSVGAELKEQAQQLARQARELAESAAAGAREARDAAEAAVARYVTSESEAGFEQHQAGYELISEGHPYEALQQFKAALEAGFRPAITHYNIACCLELLGHTDQAIISLELAVEAGYDDPEHAQSDSDLASLRGEEGFKQVIARMENATR